MKDGALKDVSAQQAGETKPSRSGPTCPFSGFLPESSWCATVARPTCRRNGDSAVAIAA
ncbi:hypothetical protein BZL30_0495 [Mycobacterium kansasii]|uniref:Uncharacterized protein n=1 Tax=Mycobacterium kansasii TaxID=1768 RepID=A0A1V3XSP4_MYCKA|nr:hypothetical protein BZL30_0495 [Mycobacterium kansasii]